MYYVAIRLRDALLEALPAPLHATSSCYSLFVILHQLVLYYNMNILTSSYIISNYIILHHII